MQICWESNLEVGMCSAYIKREYVSVDTFIAISTCVIKQCVDFNNIYKNPEISHMDVVKCEDYMILNEYI